MNRTRACEILGINPFSSMDQTGLKRQYHVKALEYHPDKCKLPDATEKFQSVKQAYDYLCNDDNWIKEKSKDEYDSEDEEQKESETKTESEGSTGVFEMGSMSSYESLIRFFTGTLNEQLQEEYTRILLEKMLTICEKQAIEIIKQADDRKFHTIYKILTKYKNAFHLSENFYEEMEKNKIYRMIQGNMKKKRLYDTLQGKMDIREDDLKGDPEIRMQEGPHVPKYPPTKTKALGEDNELFQSVDTKIEKMTHVYRDFEWDLEVEVETPYEITTEYARPTEVMILKPTLNNLWENNLYKYTREKTYLIPLWHHEIVYELNTDTDLVIQIHPKMPSNNIWIDENNNIHQTQEYSLFEIWGFASKEQCMFVFYGQKKFMFYPHELMLRKYQTFVWKNQGISLVNESNSYDVSCKSDVILHVYVG